MFGRFFILCYPNRVQESSIAFLSHFKSLLKAATNCDSIDKDCAYAYYSFLEINSVAHYYINSLDVESELTSRFKDDIIALTPEKLVAKYGTHAIIDASRGSKFEVLYKCNTIGKVDREYIMNALYECIDENFGREPIIPFNESCKRRSLLRSEQIVFNTLGFSKKLFGLIYVNRNHSSNLLIDLNKINTDNSKYQFVQIGKDGLIPLYDLISDSTKQQDLKNYLKLYLSK